MRVALIAPGVPADERANFGVGCDAMVECPFLWPGMAYIVDPDHIVLTNLWTGEKSWPIRELLERSSRG